MTRPLPAILSVLALMIIAALLFYVLVPAAPRPPAPASPPSAPTTAPEKKSAENLLPPGPKPRAVVIGDSAYHFGTKIEDSSFTKEWIVENHGQADLTLELEPPSCACVTVQVPPGVSFSDSKLVSVKPGGKAPVSFRFETKKLSGKYRWPMSVVTNDPDQPKLTFVAEGVVRPPLIFDPQGGINFLDIYSDDPNRGFIKFYSIDHPHMKILELESTKPQFLTVESRPLDPSQCRSLAIEAGYQIDVTIKQGAPPGTFREIVSVKTDHPVKPDVGFVVAGRVRLPIAVLPERIRMVDLSAKNGGEASTKLVVRGRRKTTFHVDHAPDHVQVEILPADPANDAGTYRLTARVLPGASPGRINGTLLISTDHPRQPELRIPLELLLHASR